MRIHIRPVVPAEKVNLFLKERNEPEKKGGQTPPCLPLASAPVPPTRHVWVLGA